MSLLKWKEMAEKRSELGKKINTVKETIKQKSISDQMGEVEAEKLFKPITSGLKELTAPKTPLRRLVQKKRPIPDYALEIGDDEEVPDYGLEDLFGEQVQPQTKKQLVPKLPSYEDILEDIASGEKKMYIDPEYMYETEDLPPEYEEEVPDYAIIEEDTINQALNTLELPNYNTVEKILNQEEMNNTKRKAYLNKIIKDAMSRRKSAIGLYGNVKKRLYHGNIGEAQAQYEMKVHNDTRLMLNDYIKHFQKKISNIKGSGFRKKRKRGGQIQFFNNPAEMMKKLELIIASMAAGNNSIELRNTGVAILDILLKNSILNKPQYTKIMKNYFI